MTAAQEWIHICNLDDLVADSGMCALVGERQVALFYIPEQKQVFAIDNYDPVGKANVLSRGLIGSAEEKLFVASPLYKERYCLESGECLDNDELVLDTWQTRIDGERLLLDPQPFNRVALKQAG
ncbi:nitrite reductase small subunit [Marinobacterium zhoushanense]|uniref:Nitrite reductase small subunit n=1 Tax=Marinobacterium zhoushanense TaxID=1679163 RepID=A0ABQ1JW09_9GAMM|nr:nitrite reductase small subunit NirD [Marinobacterium zhoushanense]GGB79888.1 nitrite reductase small subunit [Marinobacterium zhoushanense]